MAWRGVVWRSVAWCSVAWRKFNLVHMVPVCGRGMQHGAILVDGERAKGKL